MACISIYLIGTFPAFLREPVTSFVSVKVRALLFYLATGGDRSHPSDVVAGMLWSE